MRNGEEVDYFDHPNTIGFVRLGDPGHADSGLAVVISNGEDGEKNNVCGENRKGEVWHEITGSVKDTVAIDEEGKAVSCQGEANWLFGPRPRLNGCFT